MRPSLFVSTAKGLVMKRILIFACLTFAVSQSSAAETSPYDQAVIADARIETVVVSASQAPVPIEQTGSAITVIDTETLQSRQTQSVFDVLREVPGAEVSRTGTVGSLSQIRIRGAEAGHTLVLIDGVRANDPAQSSEEFNFAHLLAAGIERIEVLRGPQSALWGADALAGVVNVITAEPRPGFSARASAEYGSFDSKQLSGLLNVGNDRVAVVFDATWLDTAGINIAHNGHEDDGYRNVSAGVRAVAHLAPTLSLSLALHHTDAESDFPAQWDPKLGIHVT